MAMYASLAQFRDLWPHRILGVAALVGRLQLVDEDFLFGALRFARSQNKIPIARRGK